MSDFKRERVTVTYEMNLDFSAEEIWPQLCPVREYDWIEVWDCEIVHTRSGSNELGCIFRTDFPAEGDTETWVTSRFDPCERLEFVRTNAQRVIHYMITLTSEGSGTRLTWTQDVTALNEQGNEYVETKPAAFASNFAMLEKMLGHYLQTGTMLRGHDLGLMERIKAHVHDRKTG